jgi:hypothetical protein
MQMFRPERFCCANMFLSAVTNRPNLASISESSRPFLMFFQPTSLSLTDLDQMSPEHRLQPDRIVLIQQYPQRYAALRLAQAPSRQAITSSLFRLG